MPSDASTDYSISELDTVLEDAMSQPMADNSYQQDTDFCVGADAVCQH